MVWPHPLVALLAGALMAVAMPGSAESQAAAAPAPAPPPAQREMAMFQNSDVVLWLRATNEGMVLVYASPGYRNAFAKPVALSADEADHWAALADSIAADSAQPRHGDRNSSDTSSLRTDLGAGDLEITTRPRADPPSLAMRLGARGADPVSSTFFASALRIVAPALRDAAHVARQMAAAAVAPPPPPQVAAVVPTAAPTAAPTAGAQSTTAPSAAARPSVSPASRTTAATSPQPTAARPPSEPPPATQSTAPISPTADEVSEPVPQSPAPVLTAPAWRMAAAAPPARWTADLVASVAPPMLPAAAPPTPHAPASRAVALAPVPRIARTTLHLVLRAAPPPTYYVAAFQAPASPTLPPLPPLPALPPAPRPEPVATAPVATAPVATAPVAKAPVAAGRDSATAVGRPPAVRATVATATDRVATTTPPLGAAPAPQPSPTAPPTPTPTPATTALPSATPPLATPPLAPAGRSAAADSADPDAGRLSDAVFDAEVRRREPALNSCYTQYGLPNNPTLSGHITIHVSLSDSGEVMRATVADRSWAESAGSSVESCVVHRVFVWHFPVALHSSMHDFTLSFGR